MTGPAGGDSFPSWMSRAADAGRRGDFPRAEACYRRALVLCPEDAVAARFLGSALLWQGRFADAEPWLRKAVTARPGDGPAWCDLAGVLESLRRMGDAGEAYLRALDLLPGHPGALAGLGRVRLREGRGEDSAGLFLQALAKAPRADVWADLALAEYQRGRPEEALAAADRALAFSPSDPRARFHRGMVRIATGDRRGWQDFEGRLDLPENRTGLTAAPRWKGEACQDGRLLLAAEHGFGDTFQFARFVPAAARRFGGPVRLSVPPSTRRLFAAQGWPVELADDGVPHPGEAVLHLMSFGSLLGLEAPGPGGQGPYLTVPDGMRSAWRSRLGPEGFKVGLVWAGEDRDAWGKRRFLPLRDLEPLSKLPGLRLFSLQKGPAARDLDELPWADRIVDLSPGLEDWLDTAGALSALDLVIAVDTAVPHLAGALGCPVWLLLKRPAPWIWGLEGTTTPWFPAHRLFRQRVPDAWEAALAELFEAARGLTGT